MRPRRSSLGSSCSGSSCSGSPCSGSLSSRWSYWAASLAKGAILKALNLAGMLSAIVDESQWGWERRGVVLNGPPKCAGRE